MPNTPPAPPALSVRAASRSDVGMRRATNQDSLAIVPAPAGQPISGDVFLMVADGMGAHAAGELASKMATDTIPFTYQKSNGDAAPSALREAIRKANNSIHAKGSSSLDFHGMGTTCSCLVLTQGAALVGHVGDSRVYRLRDGVLEQLTFDHSLVWEMAAASNVPEDKVPSCIPKNVITRSLGPHESVNVDLEGPHPLRADDVFLLCSDGLTGVVDDKLAGAVLSTMEPDAAAQTLVDLANLRGGPDNISVVVAQIENDQASSPVEAAGTNHAFNRVGAGVTAACVCLAACGWLVWQGHVTGMLVAAAGLGAAVAYVLAGRTPQRPAATPRPLTGSYGNGPYRQTPCGDQATAAKAMRQLVSELADLSSEEDTVRTEDVVANGQADSLGGRFLISWSSHRDDHQAANAAYDRGDYPEAIARYAGILRAVVQAVREDDGTHRYKSSNEVLS